MANWPAQCPVLQAQEASGKAGPGPAEANERDYGVRASSHPGPGPNLSSTEPPGDAHLWRPCPFPRLCPLIAACWGLAAGGTQEMGSEFPVPGSTWAQGLRLLHVPVAMAPAWARVGLHRGGLRARTPSPHPGCLGSAVKNGAPSATPRTSSFPHCTSGSDGRGRAPGSRLQGQRARLLTSIPNSFGRQTDRPTDSTGRQEALQRHRGPSPVRLLLQASSRLLRHTARAQQPRPSACGWACMQAWPGRPPRGSRLCRSLHCARTTVSSLSSLLACRLLSDSQQRGEACTPKSFG